MAAGSDSTRTTGDTAEARTKPRIPRWKFIYAAVLLTVLYLMACAGSWFFGAHHCESVAIGSNLDVSIERELRWFPPGVQCVLRDDNGTVLTFEFGILGSH